MAVNRNIDKLLITSGDASFGSGATGNYDDWTFVNLGTAGPVHVLRYEYDEGGAQQWVTSVRASANSGDANVSVSAVSPAVDITGAWSIIPTYHYRRPLNAVVDDALKFLVSFDGGTTWKASTSGSSWTVVAVGDILTAGMTGAQLAAAALPIRLNNVRVRMAATLATGSARLLDFFGYNVVAGSNSGFGLIHDYRWISQDWAADGGPLTRIDGTPPGAIYGTWALDPYTSDWYAEAAGFIARSGSQPVPTEHLGFTSIDLRRVFLSRGLTMRVTGDIDEDLWRVRILVTTGIDHGDSAPIYNVAGVTWKAWDGSAWNSYLGTSTEVSEFADDGSNGMTIEQFNTARWDDVGAGDQLVLFLFAERLSYNEDLDEDYWIEGIEAFMAEDVNEGSVPPATRVGSENVGSEAVNIVMGGPYAHVQRYSDVRGEPLPPLPYTVRGVVADYEGDPLLTARPYMIASTVDADGEGAYFGMPTEPSGAIGNQRWWGSQLGLDDWSCGLVAHFYDDSSTDSGSAGQWAVLAGRAASDPYKFYLANALATPPSRGDKFHIGRLVWIAFPEVGVVPPYNRVNLDVGEVMMRLVRGTLRATIEAYPGGDTFEITTPGYPFRAATHRVAQLEQQDIRSVATKNFAVSSASATSAAGREISLGFATIVDRGDWRLEQVCYLLKVMD